MELMINKQAALDLFEDSTDLIPLKYARQYIEDLPGTEIIRCKDCMWRYRTEFLGKESMVCDYMDCIMGDDGFCSKAVKEE